MQKFKIISRQIVLDEKYCPIEKQLVELPNGETTDWFVNKTSDAVIVIPILKNGRILLQKNYKHGCGEFIWEFPAGMMDKENCAQKCAERELLEETGLQGKLEKIGETFANPTGAEMRYHFFVAKECEKFSEQDLEPAEQIELHDFADWNEVKNILKDPQNYSSAGTLAALFFFDNYIHWCK